MKHYDYVFVTHLPSFYKVNLYNKLASQCSIFVIFVAQNSDERTSDFSAKFYNFDFMFLNPNSNYQSTNFCSSCTRLFRVFQKISYSLVILSGWDLREFWITWCIVSKNKLAIALESSIYDSITTGFKGLLKKIFVSRLKVGFVSGQPHAELFTALGGNYYRITNGVGLFNKLPLLSKKSHAKRHFLFVGRLVKEKNVNELIDCFNKIVSLLGVVGDGPLRSVLELKAKDNIKFLGYVHSQKINEIFANYDVLVLPSLSEPWGLVVEEALYYGLPVIVSSNVGSNLDIVKHYNAGIVYDGNDPVALTKAITLMNDDDVYKKYVDNVSKINFEELENLQVRTYVDFIKGK